MIRDAVQSVDLQVPVFGVKTIEQRVNQALARPQFYGTAVSFLAGFAVVLATMGIYGTVSYSVAQRMREMSVRMALGGTATQLRVSLLGQTFLPIVIGAILGIVGAVLGGRLLEHLVFRAQNVGLLVCGGAVLCIGGIAGISIWVATRPIDRVNVMELLRTQ